MTTLDSLRALYRKWTPLLVQLCHPTRPHFHGDPPEPCESPGKAATPAGYNRKALARFERADAAELDAHLEAMASHLDLGGGNLGLVLPPTIYIIDPDSAEATTELARRLPEAPFQATARGGHFPVRVADGLRLRAGAKLDLGDGIVADIKTPGQHIACEPSVHASGAAYAWKRALPSCPEEVAKAPAWLLEALRIDGKVSAPAVYERGAWDGELPARVAELLERDAKLRARWGGETAGLADSSPSGIDLSVATLLAIADVPGMEIEAALRVRREQAGADEARCLLRAHRGPSDRVGTRAGGTASASARRRSRSRPPRRCRAPS